MKIEILNYDDLTEDERAKAADNGCGKEMATYMRITYASGVEQKAALCVGVTKDLTSRVKAGDIVKLLAPIVGGGGGGRPDMAQAGGKQPEKIGEVIAKAPQIVRQCLS